MSQFSRFEPYSTPDILDYTLQCAIVIGAVTLLFTIIGATFIGATWFTVWVAVIASVVWITAFVLRYLLHRYWE